MIVVQPSPFLKTWEIEGSYDLKSLFYWESMKVLHVKYLCDVGISEGFGRAISGQAESVPVRLLLSRLPLLPKPGGSCQGKEQVKSENVPLLVCLPNSGSEQLQTWQFSAKVPSPSWVAFDLLCV